MATKKKRKRRPNMSEKISSKPLEHFINIKADARGIATLTRYLNTMKQGAAYRAREIDRAGLFSYAYDALIHKAHIVGGPASSVKKRYPVKAKPGEEGYGAQMAAQRNALLNEVLSYREFFLSETSTVEGIERVHRQQDIEAFGKNALGEPKKRMTESEREKYWAAWEDFRKYKKDHPHRYEEGRLWIGAVMRNSSVLTDSDIAYIASQLGETPEFFSYAKGSIPYLSSKALWWGEDRERYEQYFRDNKNEVLQRLEPTRGTPRKWGYNNR